MSAFKNIVLFVLTIIFVLVGAVIVSTVADANTPYQWAIFGTGMLIVMTPLLWIHGMVKYFHDSLKTWIDANQMENVPAVHLGYDLPQEENLQLQLQLKQEELNQVLARGLVYKAKMEARVAWINRIHEAEINELFLKVQDLSEKLQKEHDQLMISEYDLERVRRALGREQENRDLLLARLSEMEKRLAVYRLLNWADKTHASQVIK